MYDYKNMKVEIEGNVLNKEEFVKNLGHYFSYKSSDKISFKMPLVHIELKFYPKEAKYVKDFIFDGGQDSSMYNSTKLIYIYGLNGQIWEEINDYTKYSQIKICLENSNNRCGLDNIIKKFDLQLDNKYY